MAATAGDGERVPFVVEAFQGLYNAGERLDGSWHVVDLEDLAIKRCASVALPLIKMGGDGTACLPG